MGIFGRREHGERHEEHHEEHHEHRQEEKEIALLERIADELGPKHLSFIKIAFSTGENTMALGPVKLTVGQKTKATVLGFDQNGAPFVPVPSATYALDNSTLDSSIPDASNGDDIVSLSAGVANLTATVQGPNGPLTDTETITNSSVTPVLSSIKIDFSTPV